MIQNNIMFSGKVVKGAGLGAKIGFPTINLEVDQQKKIAEFGVYICEVVIKKNIFLGVMHYGPKFVCSNDLQKIYFEVHILDFDKNVYGKEVTIHLLKKIREVRKFIDVQALKKQIKNDIKLTKKYFNAK